MLYRKYRPQKFSEIEGQEHVVRTLQGALTASKPGHAYLFCGPRGTGKTTIARIFAKALNCADLSNFPEGKVGNKSNIRRSLGEGGPIEPCNVCPSCVAITQGSSLDLIEIDAASNRGIDEIRNVKESAQVAAASSGYKIFLIDEAHMLTQAAFNALLKTLEEPPAHVVFILATTESHKLPETVLSRVQRFDFRKIGHEDIAKKITRIAKAEKVSIEPQAVTTVARAARGSLRDAESIMTKLISYGGNKIDGETAASLLGLVPLDTHEKLLGHINQKQTQDAVQIINDLYTSGVDLEQFTTQFISFTRDGLLEAVSKPSAQSSTSIAPARLASIVTAFMKAQAEMKNAPIPQLPLELAIFDLTV